MREVNDERFEQLMAFLGSQLPAPVEQQHEEDGSVVFVAGVPAEVLVRLTPARVTVWEVGGRWRAPGHVTLEPRRIGTLCWPRLPETPLLDALAAMVRAAREARLSRYRPCAMCGAQTPPEQRAGAVCASCAESRSSRVH